MRRLAKVTALENPLRALQVFGQSVWLDYIRRSLITSGELQRLIDEDGLRGVTSNPAIFEKAIAGSSDYADILEAPGAASMDATALYERLAIRDIQDAADLLRPRVRARRTRRDGYVSLEVSPLLAADTAGTLAEARRLWAAVGRANLMIKVPAHAGGHPRDPPADRGGHQRQRHAALRAGCLRAGGRGLHRRARSAGRARRRSVGASPAWPASSSAGSTPRSTRRSTPGCRTPPTPREQALLQSLQGKVAIANAKLAYQRYQELFSGPRWRALAERGAQTQRLLWASTGTKNANYRDVLYVEELIGPDTVNTMPPPTLAAFRDHGRPRASLAEDLDGACDTMRTLAEAGISLKETTDALLADGMQLFAEAFHKLLAAVEAQSRGTGADAHPAALDRGPAAASRRRSRSRSPSGRRTGR